MPTRTRSTVAALAAALTALLVPAGAVPAGAAAAVPAAGSTTATAAFPGDSARGAAVPRAGSLVTLVTGDRVRVGGDGKVTGFLPAEGRAGVPVKFQRDGNGHTHVVPQDATRLILDGTLDRRLFDVTELSSPEFRAAHGDTLPFIVGYDSSDPAARPGLRAAAGPGAVRTLRSIGSDAVATAPRETAEAWTALTRPSGSGGQRTTAPGVSSVSLDGLLRTGLDRSVPQIGAPKAWESGYDGEGVTIAVLDTGIDTTHPDLAGGKVIAEENFSTSPGTTDRHGHGTHVASTAAGTGAASGGTYRGVAPGAKLLNGKVISDENTGTESGIVAGMEWAVAQGADVVNLSIGAPDSPGEGPMERALNRLSAESGTLFVVAAGNTGPAAGGVTTPGTADAALTVGAVDKEDRLADFSARGPRPADAAPKPDLTAPGVSVGAALAEGSALAEEAEPVADGYGAVSGTSMATPHVAGAAALLAQQHPDWTGRRLKSALTGSAAAGGGHSVFEQGTGRVDAARATAQTLAAESSSLAFGTRQWPHQDDEPVTGTVTYRNDGERDITLALTTEATGPDGGAAPEGMFTLDAERLTVPAGGTASVGLTADTRPGGDRNGAYGVTVTAAGGGQSVRTSGGLVREEESYDLTVRTTGRDGTAPGAWAVTLYDFARRTFTGTGSEDGASTVRLPRGTYLLSHEILHADATGENVTGLDWQLRPELELTGDTTVAFDARRAEPVELTVPDPEAQLVNVAMSFDMTVPGMPGGDSTVSSVWLTPELPDGFHTGHTGPEAGPGMLHAKAVGSWESGGDTEYRTAFGQEDRLFTGLRRDTRAAELAELSVGQGTTAPGRSGSLLTEPDTGDLGAGWTVSLIREAPGTVRQFLNTGGVRWSHSYAQLSPEQQEEAYYTGPQRAAYTAGERYAHTFNVGVFGPLIEADTADGLYRRGNTLLGRVNPLADGSGHRGRSDYDSASTTLYRDGEPYAASEDVLDRTEFTLPEGRAGYRLVTTLSRGGAGTPAREVTAEYTFSSEYGSEEKVRIPASAVRFTPELALDSTAPAGAETEIPVTVQGAAAAEGPADLRVLVSFDGGGSWRELPVRDGRVIVTNPVEAGTGVSLRAELTDRAGNELTQTVTDAYLIREN